MVLGALVQLMVQLIRMPLTDGEAEAASACCSGCGWSCGCACAAASIRAVPRAPPPCACCCGGGGRAAAAAAAATAVPNLRRTSQRATSLKKQSRTSPHSACLQAGAKRAQGVVVCLKCRCCRSQSVARRGGTSVHTWVGKGGAVWMSTTAHAGGHDMHGRHAKRHRHVCHAPCSYCLPVMPLHQEHLPVLGQARRAGLHHPQEHVAWRKQLGGVRDP